MITPIELITQTSRRLVDQEECFEYTTWSKVDLLDAFNFALGVVAKYNKAYYSRPVEVHLRPGEVQELGDDCEELVGVLNLYAGQRLIGPVPLITVRPVSLLRRPWCADPYRPAGVELTGGRTFRVVPPVPEGMRNLRMIAVCFKAPRAENLDEAIDVPVSHYPAVLELMMYYGHSFDIEAVPSRDRADAHWTRAMLLLGVAK